MEKSVRDETGCKVIFLLITWVSWSWKEEGRVKSSRMAMAGQGHDFQSWAQAHLWASTDPKKWKSPESRGAWTVCRAESHCCLFWSRVQHTFLGRGLGWRTRKEKGRRYTYTCKNCLITVPELGSDTSSTLMPTPSLHTSPAPAHSGYTDLLVIPQQ